MMIKWRNKIFTTIQFGYTGNKFQINDNNNNYESKEIICILKKAENKTKRNLDIWFVCFMFDDDGWFSMTKMMLMMTTMIRTSPRKKRFKDFNWVTKKMFFFLHSLSISIIHSLTLTFFDDAEIAKWNNI